MHEWEYPNIYKKKKGKYKITTVELVSVGMEQSLPVFIPCEMLHFLPEVLFVPLVDDKVWESPECVW